MVMVGERAKTINYVDRRPQYWVPPDQTGTVIRAEKDCIVVQMDEPIEECDLNQVKFTPDDYGVYWWQARLEIVEKVYHHHFVFTGEMLAPSKECYQQSLSQQQHRDQTPDCPQGFYWNGRQCLRENGDLFRPSLYELENF